MSTTDPVPRKNKNPNRKPLHRDEATRDLVRLILEEQGAQAGIESDVHRLHHDWITERIEAEASRAKFWQMIREEVARKGAIAFMTFLLAAVGLGAAGAWHRIFP